MDSSKKDPVSDWNNIQELQVKLKAQYLESLQKITILAWQRKKLGLLGAVVSKLRDHLAIAETPQAHPISGSQTLTWTGIESLSRLRSLVGGRFENIKKKWVEAGLPLREHRGDKGKSACVDKDGWAELASWLLKHGYEARLLKESEEFLFEVKDIGLIAKFGLSLFPALGDFRE